MDKELENQQEAAVLDEPVRNEDFLQEDSEGVRVLESQVKEQEVQKKYEFLNKEIARMVEEGLVGAPVDEERLRDIHFLRDRAQLPDDMYRQLERDYEELRKTSKGRKR